MSNFYTQNGWEGKNYNRNLSTTEIAKIIRTKLKEKYPSCKFSVTSEYFAGGSSISISLMEAPFNAMEHPGNDVDEDYKNACIDHFNKGHCQLNQYSFNDADREKRRNNGCVLTIECFEMLKDVISIVNSYNRSDCDSMIDYFNVNFYFDINLGKWDKPFKRIEAKRTNSKIEIKNNSEVTFGEYKRHKTISLPLNGGDKTFTFGLSKAKSIIQYYEEIKKFAESN